MAEEKGTGQGQATEGQAQAAASAAQQAQGIPEHVVAELRESRRQARAEVDQLRTENVQLQSRLSALENRAANQVQSPLEKFELEHPGLVPDASVVKAEFVYQDQQRARQSEQAAQQVKTEAAHRSYRKAVGELTEQSCGKGLDFGSVLAAGEVNLTAGDKLDIASEGENAMQIAYERCIQRTPQLVSLREAHLKAKSQAQPTTKDTESTAEPKTGQTTQIEEPVKHDPAYARLIAHLFG